MILQQFWRHIRTQKIRTMITLFGITWGTAAVVLLLGVGESFQNFSSRAMHGMGESIVIVWPGRTSKAYMGMKKGRAIPLRENDLAMLHAQIPAVKVMSPEYSGWPSFLADKTPLSAGMSGVYPEWGSVRNVIAETGGRFINKIDQEKRRRVVFLGHNLKIDLFGDKPAVGKYIKIDNIPFLVIGVGIEKAQSSSYNNQDGGRAVIPASTFKSIYGRTNCDNAIVAAHNPQETDYVKKQIYRIMGKKYSFDPADEEALGMWDTTFMDQFLESFFKPFKVFLGVVAALTLVVGGIGVANIMNVVVEERTKEIGIKMAIGAKPKSVMWSFMGESLLLSGVGGLLGFGIVASVFKAVSMSPMTKYMGTPEISVSVLLIAFGVLTAVSITAGYFPARNAAAMSPVEALRSTL